MEKDLTKAGPRFVKDFRKKLQRFVNRTADIDLTLKIQYQSGIMSHPKADEIAWKCNSKHIISVSNLNNLDKFLSK